MQVYQDVVTLLVHSKSYTARLWSLKMVHCNRLATSEPAQMISRFFLPIEFMFQVVQFYTIDYGLIIVKSQLEEII